MTKLFLIATAMLSSATAPVVARDMRPAASDTSRSTDSATPTQQTQQNQRYCVVNEITGSRIAHKICKTRPEWLAEGFDPLAKN